MNIPGLFNGADDLMLTAFFIKSFGIVFSFLYLLYAVVIGRQVAVLNKTVSTMAAPFINVAVWLQILIGIGLLILAIILL